MPCGPVLPLNKGPAFLTNLKKHCYSFLKQIEIEHCFEARFKHKRKLEIYLQIHNTELSERKLRLIVYLFPLQVVWEILQEICPYPH